jgi:hypothetical protein
VTSRKAEIKSQKSEGRKQKRESRRQKAEKQGIGTRGWRLGRKRRQ